MTTLCKMRVMMTGEDEVEGSALVCGEREKAGAGATHASNGAARSGVAQNMNKPQMGARFDWAERQAAVASSWKVIHCARE